MMVCLLLSAYCVGVFSSHKMALACARHLAFMALVGQERPDFRPISDVRTQHLEACTEVFVQVVRVAGEAGLVQLGNVSTDGTNIQGHASRPKAVERLREEREALVTAASQQDEAEDAALGSRRGDALPTELARREQRMAATVRTPEGKAWYVRRKVIVEPVFGQSKEACGFCRFLRRGVAAIRGAWRLIGLTHHLRKMWRYGRVQSAASCRREITQWACKAPLQGVVLRRNCPVRSQGEVKDGGYRDTGPTNRAEKSHWYSFSDSLLGRWGTPPRQGKASTTATRPKVERSKSSMWRGAVKHGKRRTVAAIRD